MRIAVEEKLLIHLGYHPGNFITRGSVLVTVWPGDRVDETLSGKINAIFIVGPERTLEQDVEFAISQLVEIAVRALSPASMIRSPPLPALIGWVPASVNWPTAKCPHPTDSTRKAGCGLSASLFCLREWWMRPST